MKRQKKTKDSDYHIPPSYAQLIGDCRRLTKREKKHGINWTRPASHGKGKQGNNKKPL